MRACSLLAWLEISNCTRDWFADDILEFSLFQVFDFKLSDEEMVTYSASTETGGTTPLTHKWRWAELIRRIARCLSKLVAV